jgi:eukaryotic-like serine/threonine-protein kinase
MTVSAGTRLGPYEMLGALGAGGMGEVWKARDTRLGREVAVKLLPAEFAQDSQRRERFEQEARAVAALNHPNILALYDIGNQDGMAYMVTELVPGETLRGAAYPLRKALEIAAQIADGLAAAHAAGVTHRDLKPDNVMVMSDGRVKILDFGLAKVSRKLASDEATVKVTEPGAVMGTVGYMSPEQVRGAEIDPRSDIFSFGVVLHEMLGGKRAFEGASAIEAMNAILNNDPPELPDTVPSGVRDIVSHCLEKRPEQRFQSAKDLAFALRAVGGRSVSSPDAPRVVAAPPRRGAPWLIAPALLLAGVLIGAATALRWSGAVDNRLDPIQLTRFASEPEAEAFAAFSPDGRSVAYDRSAGGSAEVLVQSLDAPEPVVLVSSNNLLSSQPPIWTADGTRVCYVWNRDLMCVGAAGGIPRLLMAGVASAAFTRDGKSLIFIRMENARARLFASTPPGAEPRPVAGAALPEGASVLALSPDESKMLVLETRAGAGWVVPYPRGIPRQLPSPDKAQVLAGSWFPDSRHVALAESPDFRFRLVIADTESAARRLVVPDTGAIISAAVSPTGKQILYSTGPLQGNIVEYSLNGKQVRPIVASSNQDGDPSWSPAGDRFVYTVAATGRSTSYLWTRAADGSGAVLLAATAASGPRYSPDARRIAYIVGFAGDGIDTIATTGGRPVRIVSAAAGIQNLCWSSDGEWLWYQQGGNLWKASSQGGGQAIVVKDQADTLVDCSPDGRWIAYQSRNGLSLVSPDGKQDHVLTGAHDYGNVGQFGEGGSVLYMLRNNRRTVDALDVATGNGRRSIDFDLARADEISSFSFHPDGKRILLQTGGLRYDLWIAEGFAQPARGLLSWFRHWEVPPTELRKSE